MIDIIGFIREYWVLITFFVSEVGVMWAFVGAIRKACKCTLRNDILDIYDRCKEKKQITKYQLQCVTYSYDVYKKLKGNSFVDTIVKEEIPTFEITN